MSIELQKIIDEIYNLQSQNKIDAALDVIMNFFWDASMNLDFALMNEFYDKFDVSKITNGSILCGCAMNTFKYSDKVSNHAVYCQKAINRYKELGYEEARIHRIMDNLMEAGSYWENMAKLGAPEWISGKNC